MVFTLSHLCVVCFELNLGALHKEKQVTLWQELLAEVKWKWHWQEHYRKTHHNVTGFRKMSLEMFYKNH